MRDPGMLHLALVPACLCTALWCPTPRSLTPHLVSSHPDSFLPALTAPSPAPGLFIVPASRYPIAMRATSGMCCLLAVTAAPCPSLNTSTGYLCSGSFWIISRIYPLAPLTEESRGKGLGIMHKDAFLFAQGSSLPSCHTCPGTEPAVRQLALQGPFNPPDLTEGSITLELLHYLLL